MYFAFIHVITDMFRFVESFRYLPGEDGVDRTDNDQEDRISERYHVRGVYVRGAHQQVILPGGIVVYSDRRGYYHPNDVYQHLREINSALIQTVTGENEFRTDKIVSR